MVHSVAVGVVNILSQWLRQNKGNSWESRFHGGEGRGRKGCRSADLMGLCKNFQCLSRWTQE